MHKRSLGHPAKEQSNVKIGQSVTVIIGQSIVKTGHAGVKIGQLNTVTIGQIHTVNPVPPLI